MASSAPSDHYSSPPPSSGFSLARSLVKTDVFRVSAADVERWVRVDLEEAEARWPRRRRRRQTEMAAAAATERTAAAGLPLLFHLHFCFLFFCHVVALHLGVYASATSPKIRLETRAHNSADFRVPDADGRVLLREPITTGTRAKAQEGAAEGEKEVESKNGSSSAAATAAARERKLDSGLPLARVALRLSEESSSSPSSGQWRRRTTQGGTCATLFTGTPCWACARSCRDDGGEKKEKEKKKKKKGPCFLPLSFCALSPPLSPSAGVG